MENYIGAEQWQERFKKPQVPTFPYCFRVPKPRELDPYFGGARTFWFQRILPSAANNFRPDVRSVVVRQKGKLRGIRFIIFESAVDYFRKLEAGADAPK